MPRGTKRKIETPSAEEKAPKKIKLDIKYDSKEENQLPDEIVLQIYRQLERTDIVQCSMTCRQWYRVGQRDEFHWTYVTDLYLYENASAYHFQRNKKLKHLQRLSLAEKIEEFKLWSSDPLHSGSPVRIETTKDKTHYMFDAHDEVVAIAMIAQGANYQPFDFSQRHTDRLWKYTITQEDDTNFVKQYHDRIEGQRSWQVKLFINLKVLDSMVLEQNIRTIPNVDALLRKINREWNENSAYFEVSNNGIDQFINRPLKSAMPHRQPDGFNDDINLFKYQLDAITWMKSVEDQMDQEIIYTSASHWKGSAIYFDPVNERIVHPKNLSKHIHKQKIRGGILADDVGLGKTFEVLGLILASPPKSEIEPHPVLIDSKSTLIMCPEHLSKQWHDEITRATNLSVLLISDYNDLKRCTYEDFRGKYDVIVCVYELFKTLKYVSLPSNRTKASLTTQERAKKVKEALGELRTNRNFEEVKSPIIEHFFFHRVVFDEAHQSSLNHFCLSHDYVDLARNVWGQKKWWVSATPFNTSENNVLHFLRVDATKQEGPRVYQVDLIYRDYLWRTSKDSVKDELVVPETVDDLHFVEFTPIERAVYFTSDYDENEGSLYGCKTVLFERGLKMAAEQRLEYLRRNFEDFVQRANYMDQIHNDARQSYNLEQNESRKKALQIELERVAKKATKNRRIVNIQRNAMEILEEEIATLADKPAQAKTKEDKEFIGVQQRHGTKVAGLLFYLKKLFQEKPDSRVIIFSEGRLHKIEMLLSEKGIMTTSVLGNVHNKVQAIEDFKKEMAPFKVIMMNSQENSAGTNMIEASHVVLLDPNGYTVEELRNFETQAIGRAYRQGQTKQITVVRILFKDSVEHSMYLKMNNMPVEGLVKYDPETWKPHHGAEGATNIVQSRIAKLGRSGSFSGISLQDLKQSLEIQNNTNERKDGEEEDDNNNNNENEKSTTKGNKKKKPAAAKKKVTKKNTKKNNNDDVDDEQQNGENKNADIDDMQVEEKY